MANSTKDEASDHTTGLAYDGFCDPQWPPGTVKLAQLLGTDKKDAEIILQPRPTTNPNDPLVSLPEPLL